MSVDLEKLKALCEKATPGSWEWRGIWLYSPAANAGIKLGQEIDAEDAAFIAAARSAVPELIAEVERLNSEACGTEGELMGMRVTAGFFQYRCEVLEKLLNDERLTDKEQTSLQGCCPLEHPPHVVCRGCGLTLEDYQESAKQFGRPAFVPWPHDKPPQYNGRGEPCDMWTGPCSCGATHRDGV